MSTYLHYLCCKATIDVGGTQLSALDIEGSILQSPCEPRETVSIDVYANIQSFEVVTSGYQNVLFFSSDQ